MNRKLLVKILAELEKESPKLDYVRGILETIMENLPEDNKVPLQNVGAFKSDMSEAEIMDAKARAAIKTVKELSILDEEK